MSGRGEESFQHKGTKAPRTGGRIGGFPGLRRDRPQYSNRDDGGGAEPGNAIGAEDGRKGRTG